MNRNRLKPVASLLVLCFLLVSVVSRSSVSAAESGTFHTFYSQKSETDFKRIVQLIIEEKEGEKGSEKQSASAPAIQTVKLSSTRYRVCSGTKVFIGIQPAGTCSLYLTQRSLRI